MNAARVMDLTVGIERRSFPRIHARVPVEQQMLVHRHNRSHKQGIASVHAYSLFCSLGLGFLFAAEASVAGQVLPFGTQDLPVLKKATEVRQLSEQEARRGYPVQLRGVVTYYDRDWFLLFVQDSTAGIFISPEKAPDLLEGQLVEIRGVTAAGYAPEIAGAQVNVIGSGEMPPARLVGFTRLSTGTEDSQWVQVAGIVRSVEPDQGHFKIKLALEQGFVELEVRNGCRTK